ncbi:hypothetical protein EMCRGX_G028151 [Ephydatia muelleri]
MSSLPNEHLRSLSNDFLYHLGYAKNELFPIFGDVKLYIVKKEKEKEKEKREDNSRTGCLVVIELEYHLELDVASDCPSVGAMTVTMLTECANVSDILYELLAGHLDD